jgi:hypothetical protein
VGPACSEPRVLPEIILKVDRTSQLLVCSCVMAKDPGSEAGLARGVAEARPSELCSVPQRGAGEIKRPPRLGRVAGGGEKR